MMNRPVLSTRSWWLLPCLVIPYLYSLTVEDPVADEGTCPHCSEGETFSQVVGTCELDEAVPSTIMSISCCLS
jgi:hypothetical protein